MEVSEYIEGVSKGDDDEYELMISIRDNCNRAKIEVPQEVVKYLDSPKNGVVSKLRPGIENGVTSEQLDNGLIIEIDLSVIDENIDIIRITKEW